MENSSDYLKEIVSSVILIPIVWFLLKNIINNLYKKIEEIKMSVWKTILDDNILIDYVRTKMWFASENKLLFIKARLDKNNLILREKEVKKSILVELETRTEEYTSYFRKFNSKIWNVWIFIQDNFDFDDFIKELYDVVFRKQYYKTKEYDNQIKINDIRNLMKDYQNRLIRKMIKELWQTK